MNRFPKPLRHAGVAATLCLASATASAFDDDVFTIAVSISERYDQNLFLLPDGVAPPNDGRRSALTRQTGLEARFAKAYGQQQFEVYGNFSKLHYVPYADIDFSSHTYGASWAWTLTPELTGHVSIAESRTPNNFSDTGFQTSPNPRTQETKLLDVDYRPGAALHPRFSLIQSEDKSAQTTIERQNAQTDSVEAALVYEFRSANTADLYFRRGRGHYFDLDLDPTSTEDSQFSESEVGLAAHYNLDGVSSFDGRVGFLDRQHREFAQRDFAGVVAQIDYSYVVTGKSRVQFGFYRTLTASETAISSYSRDQGFSIGPVWAATGKVTVRSSFAIGNRDFRGSVTPHSEHLSLHMRDESLEVTWEALRELTLAASVFHSSRNASDPLLEYSNRGGLLSAKLHF